MLSKNDRTVSLGYLFSETTAYLCMKPNEHEFKLMGMAPYADSDQLDRLVKELKLLLWIDGGGQFASSVNAHNLLPQLMRIYAFERFDVISGAIQKVAESLICEWAAYWSNKTGTSSIAVSGGVFMNVKAVKRLAGSSFIHDLFVVPSASDESLLISAFAILNRSRQVKLQPISDLYLGQSFSDDYVEKMISREGLAKEFEIIRFSSDDVAEFVGDLLAKNEIVARCAGVEEWGARVLGNRSILCNPSNFQNIERLNSKIKCRDFWIPFIPSILSEHLHRYAVNPKKINATYNGYHV
ncbi:carbamoyltransferase C-terminal domain-containing protein [Polynucleobacter necessarius]|uniref:carbamoyltransferase C-terminal domain-containing protein n=1 Tax=Polynucleobacter necessarius TaxID=576610 RepID=UPI002F923610